MVEIIGKDITKPQINACLQFNRRSSDDESWHFHKEEQGLYMPPMFKSNSFLMNENLI